MDNKKKIVGIVVTVALLIAVMASVTVMPAGARSLFWRFFGIIKL